MLDRIRIRNFKSLSDTGDLKIKPLTFLLGPNSAGKTSILQALLLLRQTIDSRDMKNPLIINGSYVTLGSYRDLIFKHDIHNRLGIELGLAPRGPANFAYLREFRELRAGRVQLDFSCKFGYNKRAMSVHVENLSYYLRQVGGLPNGSLQLHVIKSKAGKYTAKIVRGTVEN